MKNIPATQEFDKVLKRYGLGPLCGDAERMGGASSNVNFALDTPQGRYFCRVRRGYGKRDAFVHRVLTHLTEKGFPTAPLLHTITGETYAQHSGRFYELFPFLQGEEFAEESHEQFASMGGLIAQFHECMQDFECSIPFEYFIGERVWNNYPHLQRQAQFMEISRQETANKEGSAKSRERVIEALMRTKQAMKHVTSTWENIEPDLHSAFVHGDYHPYNVQFKGNEAKYVCDFDFVMPAERIFDIITAFVCWRWLYEAYPEDGEETPPDASYLEPYREFLTNYNARSSHPLTSAEIEALVPDMQRLLLLYGSKAAMHRNNLEGMLNWITTHLKRAEWLERYRAEFERGLSQ